MKKLLCLLITLSMVMVLVSCSSKANKPVINDEISGSTDSNATEDVNEDIEIYSDTVYKVGKNIPEGTYVIKCTKSDYGMDVIVFETTKEYEAFKNEDKSTDGDYKRAKELYAWASFYIEENNYAYIALKKENVVLLDDGMCEFNKYDVNEANMVYSGVYVVGEDIKEGTLNIKCTTSYLKVTTFKNKESYVNYHKSERYTVGEESDAIEQNSLSSNFIYKDNSTSVNLEEGMILLINDGIGEYSVDNGPIIN